MCGPPPGVEVLLTGKQTRVVGSSLHALIKLESGVLASVHPNSVGARPAMHRSESIGPESYFEIAWGSLKVAAWPLKMSEI